MPLGVLEAFCRLPLIAIGFQSVVGLFSLGFPRLLLHQQMSQEIHQPSQLLLQLILRVSDPFFPPIPQYISTKGCYVTIVLIPIIDLHSQLNATSKGQIDFCAALIFENLIPGKRSCISCVRTRNFCLSGRGMVRSRRGEDGVFHTPIIYNSA